ncbi:Hypothetical predicted protein, partial [Mytilus galloprovincialis]
IMAQCIISLILLSFVACNVFVGAYRCYHYGHANGCSIEVKGKSLPYFYKRKFTPSCNKHDICYSCANTYHVNRLYCDRKFYYNMMNACKNNYVCKLFPLDYYTAVKAFGKSHFPAKSPSWCRDYW